MTDTALMDLAMDVGEQMVRCGAEIYRVEESVERIVRAYTGRDSHVFSIPSNIMATFTRSDGESITQTRRILTRSYDLTRLDRLNDLSRWICSETPEEDVVRQRLQAILAEKPYSYPLQMLAFALTSFGFTLIFGGGWGDAAVAFFLGILIKILHQGITALDGNGFVMNLACSLVLVLCAGLGAEVGLVREMDMVIVGVIMTLVPGCTLTNSMRDFIVGDSIAGLFRLVEALLVSVGLAVGTAFALLLLQLV